MSARAIAGSLIALSIVPAVAGVARLIELASGAAITVANARFFAMPLPVVLHIVAVIPFSLVGAFQFVPSIRRRHMQWHRRAGRVLVACTLVAAITGLWMTQTYPWPVGDGEALYVIRLVAGSAMLLSTIAGIDAIRRRDFRAHGQWMMRAYAIGMGAGTQVVTHLPWFILFGRPSETQRAVLMGAGWIINIVIAEWIIRRQRPGASRLLEAHV